MLQYPCWRTLSRVLMLVLLRQIDRRKSVFLILSLVLLRKTEGVKIQSQVPTTIVKLSRSLRLLRAVLDVMTSFFATWTCNENTQLDSLIFEAPCPEVTWFFQKGLGSRLLLNALSRCGMHSFHWRFSLSFLWSWKNKPSICTLDLGASFQWTHQNWCLNCVEKQDIF